MVRSCMGKVVMNWFGGQRLTWNTTLDSVKWIIIMKLVITDMYGPNRNRPETMKKKQHKITAHCKSLYEHHVFISD